MRVHDEAGFRVDLVRVARDEHDALQAVRLEQVDLFLIHWPLPTRYDGDFVQTWRALIEAQEAIAHPASEFEVTRLR